MTVASGGFQSFNALGDGRLVDRANRMTKSTRKETPKKITRINPILRTALIDYFTILKGHNHPPFEGFPPEGCVLGFGEGSFPR
jgi:hypothetical protein